MTKFYSPLVFSAFAAALFSCSSDGIVTNDPDAQTPGFACKQGSVSDAGCDIAPSGELLVMDSRVVAYKRIGIDPNFHGSYLYDSYSDSYYKGFVDDESILKSWFPYALNDEQKKSECNYFAVYFTGSSYNYMVLSQDMTIHSVEANFKGKLCVDTEDIKYFSMLICDDATGTIRNSIKFDNIQGHTDSNWDCEKESVGQKGVFFELDRQVLPEGRSILNCIPYDKLDPSCNSEQKKLSVIYEWHYSENGTKRDLSIPCVIETDSRSWTAMLTAGEATELQEQYGDLHFADYDEMMSSYLGRPGPEINACPAIARFL